MSVVSWFFHVAGPHDHVWTQLLPGTGIHALLGTSCSRYVKKVSTRDTRQFQSESEPPTSGKFFKMDSSGPWITGPIEHNLYCITTVHSIRCVISQFYYFCSFTPIIWMHDWMTFWYSHESFNVLFWLLFWNSYSRRIKIRINPFSSCSLGSFNC